MLVIRLQRVGKKHQPSYRLVVAERRSKMIAPPTEDLGAYNPSGKKASFNKERILYWLGVGAKASVTTHNILVKEGIISEKKRIVRMKKAVPKASAPAESAPAA